MVPLFSLLFCLSVAESISSSPAIISLIPTAPMCEENWGTDLHQRALLSSQGHHLTNGMLPHVKCFTRHVLFCNIRCASCKSDSVFLHVCVRVCANMSFVKQDDLWTASAPAMRNVYTQTSNHSFLR